MMLSNTAIASLAFGSAGVVASRVQSQLVHAVAFLGKIVPQYGHGSVSVLIDSGCVGTSVYSISIRSTSQRHKPRGIRQENSQCRSTNGLWSVESYQSRRQRCSHGPVGRSSACTGVSST